MDKERMFDLAYEIINRKETYQGRIMRVVEDTISLPDGRQAVREVIHRGGAAAIVPVDREGNIILIRQYRHPAEEEILEIPAGILEEGEDPLDCAKRELEEETGFQTDELRPLVTMYTTVGFSTEMLYIYLAQGLHEGCQNLDPDEFLSVETYSLEQSVKMIFNGDIKDSKTMVGLLAYKELLGR